jgi:hypothetical protein
VQLKSNDIPLSVRVNISESSYSRRMTLYSLSPAAYRGLIRLATDPLWCSDYARILRYLDVVVSLNEAAVLEDETATIPPCHATWTQVAFLDDYVTSPAVAVRLLPAIKKL